jgi:DNA-binding NarL/FixJ family response regulator
VTPVVSVILGAFEPRVQTALEDALAAEKTVRVVAREFQAHQLPQCAGLRDPLLILVSEAIGTSALMLLKASRPKAAVIVVARSPSNLYGELLLDAGASCLAEGLPSKDIVAAVHQVARGKDVFLPAQGLGQSISRLTPRELEIFERLMKRETDGAIALALRISPETVRKHTAHIRRKLKVTKREIFGWGDDHTSAP